MVDHRHPVGDLEELVEILADDQHGASLPGEVDERLADQARRAGIDSPGRLVHDQELRRLDDLAPDDELLQVAAGELARGRIGFGDAHVETLDDVARETPRLVEGDESRPCHLAGRVV